MGTEASSFPHRKEESAELSRRIRENRTGFMAASVRFYKAAPSGARFRGQLAKILLPVLLSAATIFARRAERVALYSGES